MSDYTEAIFEGVFCECCGVYIGDAVGYPRSCTACKKSDLLDAHRSSAKKFACMTCKRRFKTDEALKQHQRDTKHEDSQ